MKYLSSVLCLCVILFQTSFSFEVSNKQNVYFSEQAYCSIGVNCPSNFDVNGQSYPVTIFSHVSALSLNTQVSNESVEDVSNSVAVQAATQVMNANTQRDKQNITHTPIADTTMGAQFQLPSWMLSTQVLYASLGERVIIAIRGSKTIDNWISDFNAGFVPFYNTNTQVLHGFMNVFNTILNSSATNSSQSFSQRLSYDANRGAYFTITGHSLGGAEAVLLAAYLSSQLSVPAKHIALETFGEPAPGNSSFAEKFQSAFASYKWYQNTSGIYQDPVTISTTLVGAQHFGQKITISCLNNKIGAIKNNGLQTLASLHLLDNYIDCIQ
ncbi:lipase family protein [Fangia hongkongensis]|uniref:lipase family protein n=1 Tax=Fangia hongkongensis TaxID=270495 RepID=UPI00037D73AA|nr:lipase family protein [Fangia hongkongensis]MBK2125430.1 hypothetical protein [Fangia hongkongensis]